MAQTRDTARIRVSEPVRGMHKARGADQRPRQRVDVQRVPKALLDAARAALREGERLRIVNGTEIRIERDTRR